MAPSPSPPLLLLMMTLLCFMGVTTVHARTMKELAEEDRLIDEVGPRHDLILFQHDDQVAGLSFDDTAQAVVPGDTLRFVITATNTGKEPINIVQFRSYFVDMHPDPKKEGAMLPGFHDMTRYRLWEKNVELKQGVETSIPLAFVVPQKITWFSAPTMVWTELVTQDSEGELWRNTVVQKKLVSARDQYQDVRAAVLVVVGLLAMSLMCFPACIAIVRRVRKMSTGGSKKKKNKA